MHRCECHGSCHSRIRRLTTSRYLLAAFHDPRHCSLRAARSAFSAKRSACHLCAGESLQRITLNLFERSAQNFHLHHARQLSSRQFPSEVFPVVIRSDFSRHITTSLHALYQLCSNSVGSVCCGFVAHFSAVEDRAHQLYKNISMLFLFPVNDGKLSTGVNATIDASCYG